MKIDYLVPSQYLTFDLETKRNSGGGMSPNVNARATALRQRYDVNLISTVEEMAEDFCLVEALWFAEQKWHPKIPENKLRGMYAERINAFCETASTKVVACCELQMARIPWWARAKIKHFPRGIVVNTKYLYDIMSTLGIVPIGYLNDAIDIHLFKPGPKEMTVIAAGGLKHIKNPYILMDIFRQLEGKMKRVYIGNAAVWSNEDREEDLVLAKAMKACTDEWIENASYVEMAYHFAHGAIGINDTWHDVSSRVNQEMHAAGVVTVSGTHPLFEGRPGVHGLRTAEAFVHTIEQLTDNFSKLPENTGHREYAVENFSGEVFLEQFDELLQGIYL